MQSALDIMKGVDVMHAFFKLYVMDGLDYKFSLICVKVAPFSAFY